MVVVVGGCATPSPSKLAAAAAAAKAAASLRDGQGKEAGRLLLDSLGGRLCEENITNI